MRITKIKSIVLQKLANELPDKIRYHGISHTLDVLESCNAYIRRLKIAPKQAYLLRTAAILHDIGIIWDYTDHENRGIDFSRHVLPKLGYSPSDIDTICSMIQSTRLPQSPKTILEEILCDADLDYLGTSKFYIIGNRLFEEFVNYKIVTDQESWDRVQVNFLRSHHYFTDFGKRVRQPVKQKYLNEILAKWGWE
ncbi:MAG: HD domain-containing protein [Saprospiraceae bacterium]